MLFLYGFQFSRPVKPFIQYDGLVYWFDFRGIVRHFGKDAYFVSCRKLIQILHLFHTHDLKLTK